MANTTVGFRDLRSPAELLLAPRVPASRSLVNTNTLKLNIGGTSAPGVITDVSQITGAIRNSVGNALTVKGDIAKLISTLTAVLSKFDPQIRLLPEWHIAAQQSVEQSRRGCPNCGTVLPVLWTQSRTATTCTVQHSSNSGSHNSKNSSPVSLESWEPQAVGCAPAREHSADCVSHEIRTFRLCHDSLRVVQRHSQTPFSRTRFASSSRVSRLVRESRSSGLVCSTQQRCSRLRDSTRYESRVQRP
jgi:hypothetical protein